MTNSPDNATTSYLTLDSSDRIAYQANLVEGKPTIVFLPGHGSDMLGGKALATAEWAEQQGLGILRFDYFGHGASSGDILAGTISRWCQDCLDVIDHLGLDEVYLVGSSLGGWLMVLVALSRPHQVRALVGIAAAPDFTEDLIWRALSQDQRAEMESTGRISLPNPYSDEDVIYPLNLITDGRKNLVLRTPLALSCPVRLLHGTADEEVPFETSEKLAANITHDNVEVVLVEGAGHRFSEPEHIDILLATLAEVTLNH